MPFESLRTALGTGIKGEEIDRFSLS